MGYTQIDVLYYDVNQNILNFTKIFFIIDIHVEKKCNQTPLKKCVKFKLF